MTRTLNLTKLCSIRSGHPFRSKVTHDATGDLTVVQPKDITDDGIFEVTTADKINRHTINDCQPLIPGDTLLSTRGRIIAASYPDTDPIRCIASGAIMILRPTLNSPLLPGYLAVYLNSEYGKASLNHISAQTTTTFISRQNLECLKIPVPPQETQSHLIALSQTRVQYAKLANRRIKVLNAIISHHTQV
jgi:restriction endonuclease S subunit